ncbi:FHA domain-containing protein [Alienimonas californiensis]|uniref:Glycogen accumulation regulator GarA n=1 Tax=Alienimonas californiensis TaxID=2527989 RepID=A0A517PA45_9PLAN|nr:FHA domain-containing protein [Alienimonas californiensis]QDT16235.1 Glycogen accumulation regulator GarA [Alienimonas californiensis]
MRLVFNPLPPANGGRSANRPVPLDRPVLFFGRHPDCDVSPLGSAKVSRRHCCVAEASGRVRVRDLGSLNGTWVNDRPVRREAPLVPGDVLRVGDVGYRLERLETVQDGSQSGVVSIAPTAAPPAQEAGAESSSDVVPI